ncbi:proline dehydrogenase family protein [Rhizobium sp. AG207R]|uniref:proline dehydrogenase family protein n=1 Tax=Rhizobium sp. AG207R TaxID=2802287 RepID=UPI0022AC5F4B|nr:proline dehydrogenase family protein [Rhizobium sp. AG207R]MCZ3374324.1 proline dehydrogenase family protein [Rhizobium sp. AG207R]
MSVFNRMAAAAIPLIPRPVIKRLSRRFIAGATLEDAMEVAAGLDAQGFGVTLDVLGESAQSSAEADRMASVYGEALMAMEAKKLDVELSIKPSALGLLADVDECEARMRRVLTDATQRGTVACLDMEDLSCTQKEVDLFLALKPDFPTLAIAVQAYLKRSYLDLDRLLAKHSRLRICKGIYVEDDIHLVDRANKDRSAINLHFSAHVESCFKAGIFVSVATHDANLIEKVMELACRMGIDKSAFEFQMLLGVCEPLRDKVRDLGFKVRIYVPFGDDWYGYSTRRLKENPRVAGYVTKALFIG